MEFHGYDFTAFNPLIVSDAKRMVEADETLARDWNTKVDRTAKIDKMIEQMCDLYDDFFCTVLGDDYNDCIDVDTENLDEMAHLYVEFCNTSNSFTVDRIQDAAGNLHKVKPTDQQAAPAPAPQNRAQRRAARRKAKLSVAPARVAAANEAVKSMRDDPEAMQQLAEAALKIQGQRNA